MKISKTLIPTLREVPADALIASHRLMFRAGMIRKLANGLFAYLPLGLRSFRKVEQIIREEMDAAACLEIKPTVVVPAELWRESGRYEAMGEAMLRVKNRSGADFVVSPTAEEAVTALVRGELSSYKQLPLSLYQINTKYRDEIRPRYGVMRSREFVMKDAYSYHRDEESLDETYDRMREAYYRVFARCALGESVITVKADSGAMGGSLSEEFMVESAVGDDTLLLCERGDYAANVEKASCKPDFQHNEEPVEERIGKLEKIRTPSVRTIAELCAFLNTDARRFVKTLIYRALNVGFDVRGAPSAALPEAFFAVAIRGDLEVNEAKLAALLKASEVALAADADVVRLTGAPVGFAGPLGLASVPIIADQSVPAMVGGAFAGALEADMHYANVVCGRDWTPFLVADVRLVKAGDSCPLCGGALSEKKGNELGHIFKLGRKYTAAMQVTYLDENGETQIPVMGTYGIGVDRTLASIIEEHHDDNGIVWPMAIAPYQVIIIPIKYSGAAKAASDALAAALEERRIEVLLDDREERPGVKFKDADLIGIPLRVVVGEKGLSLETPSVEIKRRDEADGHLCALENAAEELSAVLREELKRYGGKV
jgi:prolyl-tRNA synthetase